MIGVLMQSESPLLFYLSLGSSVLGVFFFFLRNSLREYVSAIIASVMASLNKFYESVLEIF